MSAVPAKPRPAPPPRGPQLRVVSRPLTRHTLAYCLLLLALGGLAVFATVTLNALAAADAVRTARLEQEVAEAERRYGDLVAEVAALEDPARIEQVAIDQLGMVPADGARYLVLDRPLPTDDGSAPEVTAGGRTDPLKPVLSAQR
ncbi:MAG TPA: cell division protein FtsL [Nitriliruptorales bacterium]|nr:cell division protein FtsL [Nitriliruptorales bacterium]